MRGQVRTDLGRIPFNVRGEGSAITYVHVKERYVFDEGLKHRTTP
jgi:hypothetical protein